MDEMTVKNKIEAAMNEPRAPDALVEKTVRRARAITMGRRAEQRLEAEEGKLSLHEQTELAARSMVGRLAAVTALPEQVTPETMAQQLSREPRFVQAVERGGVLSRIKSGELLNALLQEPKRSAPAPQRSEPQRRGPSV